MTEKVAVIGLGYVGLPVALAFDSAFPGTVGFDVNREKIERLRRGVDSTGEVSKSVLSASSIRFTAEPHELADRTFYVVAVPTPIDGNRQPDLSLLRSASHIVGGVLRPGAVVVFESTVYPGATEEVCGPVIAAASGLRPGIDFKLGYSPERINPGDREHTLRNILKIVSGEDEETLERVAKAYERFVEAGVHRAPSIRVAEAAKVIENTQRDLNIALMNELSLIFNRIGIRTKDVLDAAGTKWNFLRFSPGLVGGHCIGVDPYYLTQKAEQVGYHPQVILAGRRINDSMGQYIAQQLVKLLIKQNLNVQGARVGILGLTFKEDVPDIRNSRSPDIAAELQQFGIEAIFHDPFADAADADREYSVRLSEWSDLRDLDVMVLAVSHKQYRDMDLETLLRPLRADGILMDVKSILDPSRVPPSIAYWSL